LKVFLPFCEEALAEGHGLAGADLVPYQLDYPVLRTLRSSADAPLPRLGEAQVIVPDDWPGRAPSRRGDEALA